MRLRQLRTALLLVMFCAAALGYTVVVPNAETTMSGNLPINLKSNASRVQETVGSGQFAGPITIRALRIRSSPGTGSVNLTLTSLQVTLSTTQAYPNTNNGHTLPSVTYASNVGPDATVVYNGPFSGSSAGCQPPGPCPFDMVVPFATPFSYDPSQGRLLIDLISSAPTGTLGSLDGVVFADSTSSTVAVVTGDPTQSTGALILGGYVFGLDIALRADFNGDGTNDVIWQDPVTGLAQVWLLGGAQGTSVIGAANLTAGNTWRIVGVGDFNRDGHPDVVWQDPNTGAAQVWFLGGAQGNVVTGAAVLSVGNAWRIMSVADFNGDGQPDVIWQDPVSGLAQIWFLGGAQGTTVTGAANLTASNTWRIVGTGDFNQDGHPDVLWQDPVTGTTQIWYLGGAQGNVVTNAVNLAGANSWRIAAIADFNGDGHPDVVWQDPASGTSQVWLLGGAQGTNITGTAPLSGANAWRIAGPR